MHNLLLAVYVFLLEAFPTDVVHSSHFFVFFYVHQSQYVWQPEQKDDEITSSCSKFGATALHSQPFKVYSP